MTFAIRIFSHAPLGPLHVSARREVVSTVEVSGEEPPGQRRLRHSGLRRLPHRDALPRGMVPVAPVARRNLGVAQYGVWTVATAAVSMGSIIASGFGDANIQHV